MAQVSGRKSIYQSSVCIYYVLKLLGMAHYGVERNSKLFTVSCWHYLSLALFTIYWIAQYIIRYKTETYYESGLNYQIVESIWKYVFIFQYLCTIPIIYFNFSKRKHVENFLKFIDKFDAHMEQLGWKNNVELSKFFKILPLVPIPIITCNHIMIISLNLTDAFHFNPPYVYHIKFVAYLMMMEMFFLICYLFIASCYCIQQRLDSLSEIMGCYLSVADPMIVTVKLPPYKERYIVRNTLILYDTLLDAVDEINQNFSFQMILVFICALMMNIFTICLLILVFAYHQETKIENSIDFVLWLLFLIIPAYAAIYMGSRVTSRGNQFVVYVGKYANQCDDEISYRKINLLLSKATGIRKPVLNCGFFNIDLTLGTSIVATIATYMVIITQFEKDIDVDK